MGKGAEQWRGIPPQVGAYSEHKGKRTKVQRCYNVFRTGVAESQRHKRQVGSVDGGGRVSQSRNFSGRSSDRAASSFRQAQLARGKYG